MACNVGIGRVGACVAVAMAAAFVPDAARAAVAWSAPQTVVRRADLFRFAVGPGGDAVLAWAGAASGHGPVRVATAPPGKAFGAPLVVPAPGGATGSDELPAVAVDAHGGVLVAWRADSSVIGRRTPGHLVASWRSPGVRHFGRAQVLSSRLRGSVWAEVAMNGRSDAVLAWRGARGRLQVAFAAAGHFGRPRGLAGFTDGPPSVVINDAGDAAIAWIDRRTGATGRLRVVVRAHGHAVGPIEIVAPDRRVSGPELAIAGDGRVAIAWLATWGPRRLRTAQRDPQTGMWTLPSTVPDDQLLYYQPADEDITGLGFRPDDALMVGWTEGHVLDDSAVEQSVFRVATQPVGGAWNAPITLARGGRQPEYTATLAVGPEGTAAAGWYQPRTAHERGALVAAFAPPGQPFGAPTGIAPHPACTRASCSTLLQLGLGVDAVGGARAVWGYNLGDFAIGAAHTQIAR